MITVIESHPILTTIAFIIIIAVYFIVGIHFILTNND